jgi:hypothetical protein
MNIWADVQCYNSLDKYTLNPKWGSAIYLLKGQNKKSRGNTKCWWGSGETNENTVPLERIMAFIYLFLQTKCVYHMTQQLYTLNALIPGKWIQVHIKTCMWTFIAPVFIIVQNKWTGL